MIRPPGRLGRSRNCPVGTELPPLSVTPDRYAGTRYAGASGDFTPFHLDDEFARAIGLPGIILHGLYVIALLSRGLIEPYGGDPQACSAGSPHGCGRRRSRTPSSSPMRSSSGWRANSATIACDVSQGGKRVIGDGEATLSDPRAAAR